MAADPHHTTTTADAPPMSDAELLAERQETWNRFCRFVTWSIVATATVLALLVIFVA
ncbi:hypothetical protein GCM10010964_11330 [Caldovatus sediminis]|uniref:Cytochrome c oxidase subunit IV bacterial aa3 type domain-containing protein n=1 Tax=Caldovatus sediminis TaxID=2041189 RepID=A0A8J3EBA9_9PROT|nr:aa3-type cytochrome c oxidase subunit IV [Caldovatus sediminis]GGG25035.1 hypothetical protein GCM10010964_11330 [Caldovatus sediminis]